jgi:hypothetical protein
LLQLGALTAFSCSSRDVAELVSSEVFRLYEELNPDQISALLGQVHRSAEAVMQLKQHLDMPLTQKIY